MSNDNPLSRIRERLVPTRPQPQQQPLQPPVVNETAEQRAARREGTRIQAELIRRQMEAKRNPAPSPYVQDLTPRSR